MSTPNQGRIEAAARAMNSDFTLQWEKLPEWIRADIMRDTTKALTAADTHDAAHDVTRVRVDAAAVEQAARAIHDLGATKLWDERSEGVRKLYREDARAVIESLKEGK